jgi:hypothetical protein
MSHEYGNNIKINWIEEAPHILVVNRLDKGVECYNNVKLSYIVITSVLGVHKFQAPGRQGRLNSVGA